MQTVTISGVNFNLHDPANIKTEGDYILRSGEIFLAGDYPDKEYSMTEEEVAAAVRSFQPVELNVEHGPSPFDGKLGEVRRIWNTGKRLFGEVAIPRALHELLGPDPIPVSTEWSRQTKKMIGLALVKTPRVETAALMSAVAQFAGRRHSAGDQNLLQEIHDRACHLGATCIPANCAQMTGTTDDTGAGKTGKEKKVKLGDLLRSIFSGEKVDLDAEIPASDAPESKPAPADFSQDAAFKSLKDEAEKNRAEIARLRQERIDQDAALFAEKVVAARKALPAEAPVIIAAYRQAAADDHASPAVVTFGEGKTGTRVDALRALYEARGEHIMLKEMLQVGEGEGMQNLSAIFNKQDTAKFGEEKPLTPERRAALLEMTPLGQTVLKAERK